MLDMLGVVERTRGFVHNPRVFGANDVGSAAASSHAGLQFSCHASSGGIYMLGAWILGSGEEIRCGRVPSSVIGSGSAFTISGDFCFGDGASLLATVQSGRFSSSVFNSDMANGYSLLGEKDPWFPSPLYVAPGEFFVVSRLTQNDATQLMCAIGVEADA